MAIALASITTTPIVHTIATPCHKVVVPENIPLTVLAVVEVVQVAAVVAMVLGTIMLEMM